MAKARRYAGVGALPDELLLDVFARVRDHVDILRCAGVCRRWLRLIADPAFLRSAGILPEDAPDTSFVAGAFYQDAGLLFSSKDEISEHPPKFKRLYPWPGADWPLRSLVANSSNGLFDYTTWPFNGTSSPADAGWPLRFFVPNRDDGLFNGALPLASRRGLLLLRVLPAPLDWRWRKLHLAVCDPLTGRRRDVPPLTLPSNPERCGRDVTGYAILTDADDDQDRRQQRSAFKVLFTAVHSDDGLVYAYSYSSATDIWSVPIKCPPRVSGLTMSGPRAGVVDGGGIVYWLYRSKKYFYTLGVTADATEVSLTKIARVDRHTSRLQPPFPCIIGGKLSFAIVDRRRTGDALNLWTKHDDEDDAHAGSEGQRGPTHYWTRSKVMSKGAAQGIEILAFAEGRGALLVHDGNSLFTLDLENKKKEPVICSTPWDEKQLCSSSYKCDGYKSCQFCTYNSHVLYEMDWPSYILHLSAGMLGGG